MVKRLFQSINTKIVFVIVMIIVFALELIGANFITRIERSLIENFQNDRQMQMNFLENNLVSYMEQHYRNEKTAVGEPTPQDEIISLMTDFSGTAITKVYVVDTDFVILGINDNTQQSVVGQVSNNEDVRKTIIQGQSSAKQVIDPTVNARRWKMIEPVYSKEDPTLILGAIVMDSNIETIYEQISEITGIFLTSSVIAIILSLILANIVSRALTDPIREMQVQAKRIAEGDYSGEVTVYSRDELGTLAILINELSSEVEQGQATLDAERRRLDSVLSNMSDGVIATNRTGKIIIVNNMASKMLDRSINYIVGSNVLDILEIEEVSTTAELFEKQRDFLITRQGFYQDRIYRISFALIQGENGYVSGTVCVMHDVTEQQRLDAERKEFVSNVSHELRTPLTSMRSYIEALIDGAWKDEELAPRFLDVAQSETDRMIRMIKDLLHLSRIDQGRSDLQLEIIDLNAMLKRIIARFEILLKSEEYADKNYQIKANLLSEVVFVEIDPDRMTQVIDNIINNAIKYSPDGGTIYINLKTTESEVILSIKDEGMGIPEEDLDKIFQRFYRVDRARSRAMGGTGLGLAISKEVVEQHGGKIWTESELDVGTEFFVALPYIPVEEDEWL